MVNVGSLPGVATVVFDLETHAGVMLLLASVRASNLSTAEKNELRDLIFLYTNGGKEQTVRRALEQKISSHDIKPVAVKVSVRPLPPPPAIGKYRAAPTFSVPTFTQSAMPAAPAAKPAFAADPIWKHEEVKSVPADTPKPIAVVEEVSPTPIPAPIPVSVPEPVVVAAQPVTAPKLEYADTDTYLQRTREIKAIVNEKVGNPVNLVDINNEVGREYMGALLDAMKKINSGSSAASAMKRLEEAYAAVEVALKEHGEAHIAPSPTPVSIPVYEPPVITPPSAPMYPATASVDEQPELEEEEMPAPFHYEPISSPVAISREPEPMTPPAPVSYPAYEPPVMSPPPAPVHQTVVEPPLGTPAPPPSQQDTYFSSIATYDEKPQAVQSAAMQASSLKDTASARDPLFSAEVDDGMQQLLSEWSIYKKSGLFGTGPKGREHPLFKKMAPLQIPLLLAGRFEGATQEVKQSVTDYMNGWRYEQGLIYQQGETFEHYLRRVIRHILDLQKAK